MTQLELELNSLVRFLARQKIKYVILGGIAVSIYGEPRFTQDIDVNIIFDITKLDEFLREAGKYGFHPIGPDTKKIAEKTGVIPLRFRKGKTGAGCDIIIAENLIEYTSIRRGRLKKIGSVKARIITAEDLVIHKITSSRPRDIEDLRGILIRQKGELDIGYIKFWLKKIDKINRKTRLFKKFMQKIAKARG